MLLQYPNFSPDLANDKIFIYIIVFICCNGSVCGFRSGTLRSRAGGAGVNLRGCFFGEVRGDDDEGRRGGE